MRGIVLHPKKGVNPRVTGCRNCGKDIGLVLLGANDLIITCHSCGTNNIAAKFGDACGECKARLSKSRDKWRTIEENEKIPDGLCEECLNEAKEHEKIVKEGGVYWKCSDCGSRGVIKRSEYSIEVKKCMGLEENDLCGVEFDKANCPKCKE